VACALCTVHGLNQHGVDLQVPLTRKRGAPAAAAAAAAVHVRSVWSATGDMAWLLLHAAADVGAALCPYTSCESHCCCSCHRTLQNFCRIAAFARSHASH
jgi:glycine/D-amino acid oxidase-like deaminating enzyme